LAVADGYREGQGDGESAAEASPAKDGERTAATGAEEFQQQQDERDRGDADGVDDEDFREADEYGLAVEGDDQESASEQDEEDGVLDLVEVHPEMVEVMVGDCLLGDALDEGAEGEACGDSFERGGDAEALGDDVAAKGKGQAEQDVDGPAFDASHEQGDGDGEECAEDQAAAAREDDLADDVARREGSSEMQLTAPTPSLKSDSPASWASRLEGAWTRRSISSTAMGSVGEMRAPKRRHSSGDEW
jgi:hypothetical protein